MSAGGARGGSTCAWETQPSSSSSTSVERRQSSERHSFAVLVVLHPLCMRRGSYMCALLFCSKTVSAANLKRGWGALVIQRYWRGYRMAQIYQVVRLATITIQAYTRGWMARKRYRKVCEVHSPVICIIVMKLQIVTTCHSCSAVSSSMTSQMVKEQKALILQKYTRAWLARRRFQTMRRLVLNVQLSYRVQQLRKKVEEQVKMLPRLLLAFL